MEGGVKLGFFVVIFSITTKFGVHEMMKYELRQCFFVTVSGFELVSEV